jgi:hypothetical protein
MKLVMNRYSLPEKCKTCKEIDSKERAIEKEQKNINRWGQTMCRSASIEKA